MKLVIFDLDGTLLNTLDDLAAAANAALQACGFAVRTKQQIRQFVGNGVSKLLERALPDGAKTPENVALLKKTFVAYYEDHLWETTTPYPGIENLLKQLTCRGVQLAVVSNKYQKATERLVTHFFAPLPFAAVCGQREGIAVKPHPQAVFSILAKTGIPAAETLLVGDSAVDMQTAQNAAIHACGVTWGFRPREELTAFHPLLVADKPQEILSLLG